MLLDSNLNNVIDSYWKDFYHKSKFEYVVSPSIPIIWFGDIEKYMSSSNESRIITVALNPSVLEFKERKDDAKDPEISLRFPGSRNIILKNENLSSEDKISLYKSLNDYFKENPYGKWFNNFEKILNSMNATYGGKMNKENVSYKSHAIHIDIFSAIATNPTWGKLNNKQKEEISYNEGFINLIKVLQPDIILISVAYKTMLNSFSITQDPNCQKIYCTKNGVQKSSIKVMAYDVKNLLNSGKNTIVLFGRNFGGTVFGGMSDDWKKENIPQIIKKFKGETI